MTPLSSSRTRSMSVPSRSRITPGSRAMSIAEEGACHGARFGEKSSFLVDLRGRKPYPLDLESRGYSYVERPNRALLELFERHVLAERPAPVVLDVGCGAGANAREIRRIAPDSTIVGIEPNAEGARLARAVADEVFEGTLERWLEAQHDRRFDAVLLSDVVEHVADPLTLLRSLNDHPGTRVAAWLVSVPNYAV